MRRESSQGLSLFLMDGKWRKIARVRRINGYISHMLGKEYNHKDIRGKEILIWKQELKSRIVSRAIAGFPWMWKRIGITRASKTRRISFPIMFNGTFQTEKFNLGCVSKVESMTAERKNLQNQKEIRAECRIFL